MVEQYLFPQGLTFRAGVALRPLGYHPSSFLGYHPRSATGWNLTERGNLPLICTGEDLSAIKVSITFSSHFLDFYISSYIMS